MNHMRLQRGSLRGVTVEDDVVRRTLLSSLFVAQRTGWIVAFADLEASFLHAGDVHCAAYEAKQVVAGSPPVHRCAPELCILPPSTIIVLSIGSISRSDLQEAQLNTWGRHLSLVTYTEEHVPPCTLCERGLLEGPADNALQPLWPFTYLLYEKPVTLEPAMGRRRGWWCAQRRPLLAIRDFLTTQLSRGSFPEWLMIVDDDTLVNPIVLARELEQLDPAQPTLLASLKHNFEVMGGAGWLISRPVLKALLAPPLLTYTYDPLQGTPVQRSSDMQQPAGWATHLDTCVTLQNGGPQCFWHSDWAASWCVRKAVPTLQEVNNDLFAQCCEAPTQKCWMPPLTRDGWNVTLELVTCHYTNASRHSELYQAMGLHRRQAHRP